MTITVVANYRVPEQSVAEVRAALQGMVGPTRSEAGCISYDVYVDPADESLIILVECYVDQGAFDAHLATEHFDHLLRGIVLPKLVERVRYDLVPLAVGGEA